MPKVFSFEVRSEFFELVVGGVSLQAAAAVVGVSHGTAVAWWQRSGFMYPSIQLGLHGGLPGTAPAAVPGAGGPDDPPRQRRPLTSFDRSAIAVSLMLGCSYGQTARIIERAKSVISREVRRNRGPDGSYWGPVAHRLAHERRRRPKTFKLADPANADLCRQIEVWMDQGWSPRLIAAVLRDDFLRAEHLDYLGLDAASRMSTVSHETIYQALYVQTRGHLRRDLYRELSLKRRARKPRGRAERRGTSIYAEAFTIRDRPAEAADRAVPGHWEGDLILGTGNNSAIGVLVERSTRFTILLHLPGRHDASSVAAAMVNEMSSLPEHLRRSMTWDRGTELAGYRDIQLDLAMPVYFCDPHSPWQRGTGENTNRLLRHWFEKGTDLSTHTPEDLRRVAATLNARPRPTLNMRTPAHAMAALLADSSAAGPHPGVA